VKPLLRFGEWCVAVEPELLRLASPRCALAPFLVTRGSPHLLIRQESLPAGEGSPLNPRKPAGPRLSLQGEALLVEPLEEALDAELVLRAALQVMTLRQGGVLLHAGGVAFGERAAVACGPSGAGKSTFTRLMAGAGGAEVLSDEVVALYPGGRVEGSPFCSEADLPSSRASARLAVLLLLAKGPEERLEEVSPREAISGLLGQIFRPLPGEASAATVLERLALLVAQAPVRRFVFRKHAEAASFLRSWLDEQHASA
jgi:hypothetical protein